MQIEIISNINMDSLKFYLKEFEIKNSCTYGNFYIDLLDEKSFLFSDETKCVICFLDADNLDENIDDILDALKKIKDKNKILLLNTISYYPYYLDTYINKTISDEFNINKKIIDFSNQNEVLLIDFYSIVKRMGIENIYSDKFWYMGKIKYTSKAFKEIARNIKELLKANQESCKKCLVLDLDNTLWGGIISEDKIELSNEGVGSIYQEFQKKIKKLKDLGVILAINSKNNYEDALSGLNNRASFLKEEDFILIKANWEDKNKNIYEIAKELNIGEDSLVFIDDNPIERELVKATTNACVADFPEDIYLLNNWFIKDVVYKYFYKLQLNNEDLNKQEQYKAKIIRDKILKEMSYEEFLESLQIELEFCINDKVNIQRYAQLTQKTNQFNLTTKRYTPEDIKDFIEKDDYLVLGVDYKDKYAKEGIVGLIIVKIDEFSYIDTFLLSCRVLKRDIEKDIINEIYKLIPKCKKLIGEYIETPKNILVKDLYINLGFKKISNTKFEKDLK